jgi:hypothetical protein
VGEERGESDEEDVDIEDEKTQGLFLHIFMPLEGVWTKVAQLNKFRVLDFDFASSWT